MDVAVLLADISGTTRLYRKSAGGEGQYQLDRCIKRMERAVVANGGSLLMPASDELSASFATADDAVLAAIEMQRRIEDLPPLSGVRLSIRISVQFGKVEKTATGLAGGAVDIGRVLLNLAGSGQIVTCAQTAALLTRVYRQQLLRIEGMTIPTARGEAEVYYVNWHVAPFDAVTTVVGIQAAAAVDGPLPGLEAPSILREPERMTVRMGGKAFLVDERSPRMMIGRDKDSTLVLKGSRVSRHHALIERRPGGGFTLTDSSTNGTYVRTDGVGETRVYGDTMRVAGRGKIAFGHNTELPGDDVADFEVR